LCQAEIDLRYEGSKELWLVRSLEGLKVQGSPILLLVYRSFLIFHRFYGLSEVCKLFYKALEAGIFLVREVTYLPISRAENTAAAKSPAIAQSISPGALTSKRTWRPGTYRISSCSAKDEATAYHRYLFLNIPTLIF